MDKQRAHFEIPYGTSLAEADPVMLMEGVEMKTFASKKLTVMSVLISLGTF